MASRALILLLAGTALSLTGCGTFRSYETELDQTNQQLKAGQVDAALATLEANNSAENKDLLYYLEKGELLRDKGDIQGSQKAWQEADRMVFEWENSVKADPGKYLDAVGSLLVNDKVRRYEGYDYEKVMLTTQMALNDAALGRFDLARTEIKKTHEREAVIAELRDKEYLKSEEDAQTNGISAQMKDLQGYPVESLNAPEVVSLKNSYQSAFSHYLAGFVYEALGEKDLAAPGYRTAIELRPDTPFLEQALATLDKNQPGQDESDVLIVVQSGLAPARDSMSIRLPIPTNQGMIITPLSFPVMKPDVSSQEPVSMQVDGKPQTLTELNSVDAMSRRALKDDMPGIIVRTSVRAISRSLVQQQLNDNVSPLAGLVVGIASAVTESADERTWRTLPDQTRVARLRLKRGQHQLQINNQPLPIQVDSAYQIVALHIIGQQLYASRPSALPSAVVSTAPN
jgi:hypothetical protein